MNDHLFFEGIVSQRPLTPRRAGTSSAEGGSSRSLLNHEDDFYAWLFECGGMNVRHYRRPSLERRTAALLRALDANSLDDARRVIHSEPALLRKAIDTVLLGVTEFNRDAYVFNALREHVLPALRMRGGPLRIWSAACSEGQELYSVAFRLADAGMLEQCELLGTDCRPEAIEAARAGTFPTSDLANLRADECTRYFCADGVQGRITDSIRRMTQWKVADLLAGPEPGPWDLILWRNMAIYLSTDSAELVWRGLANQLRQDGYLVVGKADHPPNTFGLKRLAACIYHRA
jgi:chemotaxis methyl-accepting protein methylase